jgi:hypothetical protein
MATRNIPKREWRSFFDMLSKALTGQQTEVETASLDLGDQIVAERLPLVGITYDTHNDLLDVALQGREHFNHLIRHPKEIVVQQEGGAIEGVAVKTEDGTEEMLRFKESLRLPEAPAGV